MVAVQTIVMFSNLICSAAEFMAEEIKKYEMGKRWLAKMMGADFETFTDSDVEV